MDARTAKGRPRYPRRGDTFDPALPAHLRAAWHRAAVLWSAVVTFRLKPMPDNLAALRRACEAFLAALEEPRCER